MASKVVKGTLLALAGVALGATGAWAQAGGTESAQAREACTAAAATDLGVDASALDVRVERQRTRTRVIRLDLRVTPTGADVVRFDCTFSRKDAAVSSLKRKG